MGHAFLFGSSADHVNGFDALCLYLVAIAESSVESYIVCPTALRSDLKVAIVLT